MDIDGILKKAGCGEPHPAAPPAVKKFKKGSMVKTSSQIADEVLKKLAAK